jgi:hypothetical protein
MHVAGDIATCMYYTGIDPFTKWEVCIARNLCDSERQRALLRGSGKRLLTREENGRRQDRK